MLVPTVVYAAVALRWAVDQFQREDVLFRESEQFSLSAWLRHVLRDREPMPTGGQAALCFALILTSTWFLMLYLARQGADLSLGSVVAGQLIILLPPVIMAFVLTSDPKRTLRLAWPEKRYLVAGGRAGRGTQSAGQRAAADRRVALSDLVDHQDFAGADHVSGAGALDLDCGLRLDPGDLRGIRVSRFYPFGAGASSTGPGRPSCCRP